MIINGRLHLLDLRLAQTVPYKTLRGIDPISLSDRVHDIGVLALETGDLVMPMDRSPERFGVEPEAKLLVLLQGHVFRRGEVGEITGGPEANVVKNEGRFYHRALGLIAVQEMHGIGDRAVDVASVGREIVANHCTVGLQQALNAVAVACDRNVRHLAVSR